ncbi:hypothetical protein HG536_0B04770 [Torulaspora globosa]|uniref:Uncharacterized protein n=1 Tax=Torulaspora globosa TaxID=48254 RepID=A0A7G3ZDM7_9SACH|nr:uncharacterized protein HG536_0B04770 [Torulaspora globosa]QLL31613.1 hypothetical protein HG536_0B04770 [Torulaspora globosa]
MPLDLSPCDVGVPSCQPTFDLTKKQFLPHKNGQHIRDMVKTKQEKRADENFNQSLEISVVKWKPLLVYRKDETSTENKANEGVSLFRSIGNWWNCRKQKVPDTESDGLAYFYDQEDTTQTRRLSDTVFDTVTPFACPQAAVTAADRELIAINEQMVYQQYYSHPMAPEYVSSSHSPYHEDKMSPFRLQQNRGYRATLTRYVDWTNPCMACKFAQGH